LVASSPRMRSAVILGRVRQRPAGSPCRPPYSARPTEPGSTKPTTHHHISLPVRTNRTAVSTRVGGGQRRHTPLPRPLVVVLAGIDAPVPVRVPRSRDVGRVSFGAAVPQPRSCSWAPSTSGSVPRQTAVQPLNLGAGDLQLGDGRSWLTRVLDRCRARPARTENRRISRPCAISSRDRSAAGFARYR
jgi:hypothetical protein